MKTFNQFIVETSAEVDHKAEAKRHFDQMHHHLGKGNRAMARHHHEMHKKHSALVAIQADNRIARQKLAQR